MPEKPVGVPIEQWVLDRLSRFSDVQKQEIVETVLLEMLCDRRVNGTRVYEQDFHVDAGVGEAWNEAIYRNSRKAVAQVARRLPRILALLDDAKGAEEYRKLRLHLREEWRRLNAR